MPGIAQRNCGHYCAEFEVERITIYHYRLSGRFLELETRLRDH